MCHATTWQGSQFTLSRLAADLCLVPHSYSADRGGGAAGSVITKNCCVGRNRHVNSALTEEKELCVHFIFVHQVCPEIQNQRVFMLFWIRSVLGSFRNAPHIPADKWVWFWPEVNCLSPLNIIQCHMLSACPVNVLKLAHC